MAHELVGDAGGAATAAVGPARRAISVSDLGAWREELARLDRDVSDAERIDQLRALEELKSAACAAQARIAVDFDASQRREQAAAGVPLARRGQGVGAQVALARRESPHRGGRLLGLAKALVDEMPHTFQALRAGTLSEWRATLLVRESACLEVADRIAFDAELAADPASLEGVGDRALVARAKKVAYRLDAASVVRRARKAVEERCVSLRPAPDTMTYLTGLLPVAQGVAVLAALKRAADAARAKGDRRSRGQVMADTLVERVTGQSSADAVPVEIQLVMTERTLLAADGEPATLPGYGTVPAQWARDLLADRFGSSSEKDPGGHPADDVGQWPDGVELWLRRLFTAPTTGQLVAMDSRRRTVPPGLRRYIETRDQTCRSAWCDAPIRHIDHVVPHAEGGRTSEENLEGYCEACNYAKQAPGWRARTTAPAGAPVPGAGAARAGPRSHAGAGADQVVETTTPTGHTYRSRAPALPGRASRPDDERLPQESAVERAMYDILYAA